MNTRMYVPLVLLSLGWITFVGGCGKQNDTHQSNGEQTDKAAAKQPAGNGEAVKQIEVRIALILHPLTQGALPKKLKDVLGKAGIEVEPGFGMVYSPEGPVMSMSSDGVKITPVEGKWCKITSDVKGKGLENLPDIEFKNGGFGIQKGQLYIKDGTLARLKGDFYRFSGSTWTKQKSE